MNISCINVGDAYVPYHAALELTLACNMSCLHCGSMATARNRPHELNISEWCDTIDQLKKLGTRCFHLSGGEPLLSPHLHRVVEHMHDSMDRPVPFSIITNGTLLKPDMLDYFKRYGLSHVAVSIDGTRACHNYIRRTGFAFDGAVDAIKLSKAKKVPVSVMTSINKHNFGERKNTLDLLLELKVKNWQIQIVNSFGRARENKELMLISHEEYGVLVNDIASWQKEYGDRITIYPADSIGYCHTIFKKMLKGSQWNGCNAGLYVIGIEADGTVKGCLSLQDEYFRSGNVREKALTDIWKDDDAFFYTRKYDTSRMAGTCGECRHKETCKSGCLSIAYSVHHSIHENTYCYESIQGGRCPSAMKLPM